MLLCVALVASAYEPVAPDAGKWMGSVEFAPLEIPLVKKAKPDFAFKLSATHQISDYFAAGGVVSLSESWQFKGAPNLNVMMRTRFEDFSKAVTPFITLDLGYSQSLENADSRGFVFCPAIGYRYGCWSAALGYKGLVDGGISNSLYISLAYHFGYHRSEAAARFFRNTDFGVAIGAVVTGAKGGFEAGSGDGVKAKTGGTIEASWLYNASSNLALGIFADINYIPAT